MDSRTLLHEWFAALGMRTKLLMVATVSCHGGLG